MLKELGYVAVEAGNAAAGLGVLWLERRVDLLVTDVALPGSTKG